jgi:SAM-dependent methyltransferase
MAGRIPHCSVCELEDFADPELRTLIREAYANYLEIYGQGFPRAAESRKYWEVAMSLRAFRDFGILGAEAEMLGVGAGQEATIFWLTNHARRVFATDLYVDNAAWLAQTSPTMLVDPAPLAPCRWNRRRLVVQHMNALDLQYEDHSFDGIFSSGSIEHFGGYPEVRRAAREMYRVLRPGGVAALATEYRIAGDPPGHPGTLMFSEEELRAAVIDGLDWDFVEPLDLRISPATLTDVVSFEEVLADLDAGRELRTPHLVLSDSSGFTWTSVHIVLRKPARTFS